jgi:hypothetical protein
LSPLDPKSKLLELLREYLDYQEKSDQRTKLIQISDSDDNIKSAANSIRQLAAHQMSTVVDVTHEEDPNSNLSVSQRTRKHTRS